MHSISLIGEYIEESDTQSGRKIVLKSGISWILSRRELSVIAVEHVSKSDLLQTIPSILFSGIQLIEHTHNRCLHGRFLMRFYLKVWNQITSVNSRPFGCDFEMLREEVALSYPMSFPEPASTLVRRDLTCSWSLVLTKSNAGLWERDWEGFWHALSPCRCNQIAVKSFWTRQWISLAVSTGDLKSPLKIAAKIT